ncbi:DNA recombination protein RmuC [Desulfitobacterium metallireducens]|uniref:DNA recombination protein RmuC n=1 Tax=Desulfitobacterium metallireducens DSM 15288 TaxID=871968 RepID=W0EC33_9FIRM|nr:DNA recombination protein RmuC [Desulfitobacterium metallireducens]AHF07093.1 DNA recombination protein RmuC [Desulfitobacterium metallireducens DSM 15288]
MTETLLIVSTGLTVLCIFLLLILWNKMTHLNFSQLENRLDYLEKNLERHNSVLLQEVAQNRQETSNNARMTREEQNQSLKRFNDSVLTQMSEISNIQQNQLDSFARQMNHLTQSNEQKLELLRKTVEEQLLHLQQDNAQKLEQMRVTVDEKLTSTLEQRLGESFKLVSERLEMVHKGLGEMQTLASGVGDLKKVLTNVKTRGIWGEVQLGNLLEQVLTPEQYALNVATKPGSNDRVEFAIKIPAKDGDNNTVWLPIDAKFPLEDYERLQDAQDKGDLSLVEETSKALENRIKSEAKSIHSKYIDPPHTTDFGILFLPIEGLYAEVLRRPGLCDLLQRDYKVVITGPTTLAALLNSLQMGFRTLAIEKRSSEVWNLLGAVKTEFGKFIEILEKTQKKLQEASHTIETATKKSRTIERKLKTVQTLPIEESTVLLASNSEEKE